MPTLDSAGLQIRQDRGEQGVLPSRQQDAGSSLIPKGDASWLLIVKAYSYETVIL